MRGALRAFIAIGGSGAEGALTRMTSSLGRGFSGSPKRFPRPASRWIPYILSKLAEDVKESDIIKTLAEAGVLRSRNTYVKWMVEARTERETDVKGASVVRDVMQRVSRGRQA